MIYHIARAADWSQGLKDGEYRISTRGLTLDDVGFIHCGEADQVGKVANAAFRGEDDLVVLAIDPDLVRAEVRREDLDGSGLLFPHIYGPLDTAAVVEVIPFQPRCDGSLTFSPR